MRIIKESIDLNTFIQAISDAPHSYLEGTEGGFKEIAFSDCGNYIYKREIEPIQNEINFSDFVERVNKSEYLAHIVAYVDQNEYIMECLDDDYFDDFFRQGLNSKLSNEIIHTFNSDNIKDFLQTIVDFSKEGYIFNDVRKENVFFSNNKPILIDLDLYSGEGGLVKPEILNEYSDLFGDSYLEDYWNNILLELLTESIS